MQSPIEGDIQQTVRSIYRQGQDNATTNAGVFSVVGDTPPGQFLAELGDNAAEFNGLEDAAALSDLLFYYVSTPLPTGGNSFQTGGALASSPNWRAQDLLDPALADPDLCQAGKSPLACELRVNQPSVIFVIVGRNDVLFNTPVDQFQAALDQIIQTAASQGTIPVLMTIPGDVTIYPNLPVYNTLIVRAARQNNIPLTNLWRRLNGVGPSTVDPGSLMLTSSGVGDQFTEAELATYGVPVRNLAALRMLQQLQLAVPIP